MIPEPRPSDSCEACYHVANKIKCKWACETYKECYCSCHRVGNLMGNHHHFNSLPDSISGITQEVLDWQLQKRNGL